MKYDLERIKKELSTLPEYGIRKYISWFKKNYLL